MNTIGLLRRIIPNYFKDSVVAIATSLTPVRSKTVYTNIYHCCVYKTGSQWIRRIFSDPRIYRWCGLRPVNGALINDETKGQGKSFSERQRLEGFPPFTAVTGCYMDYHNFKLMQKPDDYAAFFIKRDPRELIVSWYFSTLKTHDPTTGVVPLRNKLKSLTVTGGLKFAIDYWAETGCFDALLQWNEASKNDNRIKVFSFEDLVGENGFELFLEIVSHCGINIPEENFKRVFEAHSPKNIVSMHTINKYSSAFNRKSKWPNYFNSELNDYLCQKKFNIVESLDYV